MLTRNRVATRWKFVVSRFRRVGWGSLTGMFSYLDPASGSMIVAAVASGAAGIAVFFRTRMAQIRAKISGKPAVSESDDDESEDAHN
jgi:hypothetical protein